MVKRWSMCAAGVLAAAVLTTGSAHAQEVVIYASDVSTIQGNWAKEPSSSGAGGYRMTSTDDNAAVVDSPLAAPSNYFEASFTAPSYTTYHVWLRLRAASDSKWNDSVYVQFSDAASPQGSAVYRINTSSALLVNLEACSNCGVSSWGWQDGAYWLSQTPLVMFGASGSHKIRVQTREDGIQIDQIVLSPARYLSSAPGPKTNDTTIVSRSGGTGGALTPFSGTPVSLPGTISASNFDNGGEGVAYHDTSAGNAGGMYRSTDVDLQSSTEGGTNIGWTAAGEWLNYTVRVAESGAYNVQLRMASATGGSLHVGFNAGNVWKAVSVPNTGGWQTWSTVTVPVTLTAGQQVLTLGLDTGGFNLKSIAVASAGGGSTSSSSAGLAPYGGTARAVPGTIEAEDFDNGGQGVAYNDTTGGNTGGQYRSGNVDIEVASEGGYDVAWNAAGEWLNYSVNVASAGSYTVQLRLASQSGGTLHVGFNGPSPVWRAVSVPATGGWQAWSTVNVPVTLGAGNQVMTVLFDTGGVNLNHVKAVAGTTTSSTSTSSGSGNRLRFMTWNIQHGNGRDGSYQLPAQVQFIASQNPDVVALQEVQTWNENQPERYRSLLQQATGQTWTVVWAPVISTAATEGNVILTRLPVSSSSAFQMHATSDWSAMYSNRSAAQATVRLNGVNVNVFSTHLDYYNTSHRSTQESQLMSWAANFGGPKLVAGDFNSWWGEYWITNMITQYSDTWRDVTGSNENGYTVNDAVRFDYIFRGYTNASRAVPTNCWVPRTTLSDHNPVIADFTVN